MGMAPHFGFAGPIVIIALLIILVWSFFWKGKALWIAARHGQIAWFVIILLVNTLGILEIVYIYFFACDCSKDPNDHARHIHGHAHSHSDQQ